ncbi:hypothetical protein B0H19DRAFT_1081632 [Mycena capillaripes]|nr:hypothetical protein B0H19DRAFT_1081632 [Mycena capillaripes]
MAGHQQLSLQETLLGNQISPRAWGNDTSPPLDQRQSKYFTSEAENKLITCGIKCKTIFFEKIHATVLSLELVYTNGRGVMEESGSVQHTRARRRSLGCSSTCTRRCCWARRGESAMDSTVSATQIEAASSSVTERFDPSLAQIAANRTRDVSRALWAITTHLRRTGRGGVDTGSAARKLVRSTTMTPGLGRQGCLGMHTGRYGKGAYLESVGCAGMHSASGAGDGGRGKRAQNRDVGQETKGDKSRQRAPRQGGSFWPRYEGITGETAAAEAPPITRDQLDSNSTKVVW